MKKDKSNPIPFLPEPPDTTERENHVSERLAKREAIAPGIEATAKPTLPPPVGALPVQFPVAPGGAKWVSETVHGLWTNDKDANGWLWATNEGWLPLADTTESGSLAMMILAASAKTTKTRSYLLVNGQKEVEEVYVW